MNSMLEQVESLPALLRDNFQMLDEAVRSTLDHELCLSLKRLFITGCGDSHHASLGTEMAIETLSGLPVEPMTALQLSRYGAGFIPQTGPKTNLVIGISVSGSVSRTAEALRMAGQANATTVALTATQGSLVAESAERVLLTQAPVFPDPPGTHTPGIRTYYINQIVLLLTAFRLGEVRGHLTTTRAVEIRSEILRLADASEETITKCMPTAKEIAQEWSDAREFVFVGSGPNYATALFSAAKILEASGDSALGQDTEEWNHLQYFAKDSNTPTFIISAGDRDLTRALETVVAARTIGRRVTAIAPETAIAITGQADFTLPIANVPEIFSPVIAAIPGELFAAYRAEVMNEPFFRQFSGGRSQEGGGGISRIRTSDSWDKWQS